MASGMDHGGVRPATAYDVPGKAPICAFETTMRNL